MEAYLALTDRIMREGRIKENKRTGTTTRSIFSARLVHEMKNGFPLLTTKKINFNNIKAEWLWIMHGLTNVDFLHQYDCHIWDQWALKEDYYGPLKMTTLQRLQEHANTSTKTGFIDQMYMYTEEELNQKLDEHGVPDTYIDLIAKKGETNAPYGRAMQRRNPQGQTPLEYVHHILTTSPDSRRIVVNYWNHEDLPDESLSVQDNIKAGRPCLTACHTGFELYVDDMTLEERWAWMLENYVGNDAHRLKEYRGEFVDTTHPSFFDGDMEGFTRGKMNSLDGYGVPRRRVSLKWHQRKLNTAPLQCELH